MTKRSEWALVCLGLVACVLFAMPKNTHASLPSSSSTSQTDGQTSSIHLEVYSVLGRPTLSPGFVNRVFALAQSPAQGTGQALYDLSKQYGIDDAYALAFFQHESSFGTTGEARVTHSLGNERCIADRPCIDQDRGGYALMRNWIDGYQHWYALLLYGYVQGQINKAIGRKACPCTTLAQIIPVYAPSSDGNDVQGYINAVAHSVTAWRKGEVHV